MSLYVEITTKILLAAICGGLIGLEREHHNQPAGLRTHIILCIGSALITLVSLKTALEIGSPPYTDPGRIAANIVTGIGFLGGGAILRMGASVRGLTTAACIWTVAGIGMAIGVGFYFGAVMVTIIVLLALHYLVQFEKVYLRRREYKQMTLNARSSPDLLGNVEKILASHRVFIKQIEVNRDFAEPNVELNALVTMPDRLNLNQLTDEIFQIPGTLRFEME